jgi:hypothetical protein
MFDYLPLIIGLLSALVGIFGKSWDDTKKGLKQITTKGWIVIFLALSSFGFAAWTISKKNKQLDKIADIKSIANKQILNGINYLLRDLVVPNKSNDTIFIELKDTSYLADLGNKIIINPDSSGVIVNGINGDFIHPFELHSANIKYGEGLLNDAIIKYSSVVDPETIIFINNIINDKFYKEKFKLTTQKMYFEIAISEYKSNWKNDIFPLYTPWSYLGLYYFNRIYDGNGKRPGSFTDFLTFIDKTQKLVLHINNGQKNPTLIFDEQ